ncbi:MAG: family 10 glycosylhydrolase [Candidatus Aminicenantes bacterium]|nr:family 10 glycosylhydrolase [Candidatus Aminicenantes bacterium]
MKRTSCRFWKAGAALLAWMFFSHMALIAQTPGPSSKSEVLGVWSHPGFFGTDEREATKKIRATLDDYVQSGINTVILLIKGTNGYVYYQSRIGTKDPAFAWDFFGVFLKEARARNITVHPWFCVFNEGAIAGEVRRHPEWLIRSPEGEMVGEVNPALPEVRAYEISLMIEILKQYPVDWVHLDYIRFPSSPREVYFSWDPRTRALFKDHAGLDPIEMKARDSGNIMWNEWIEWNAGHVTAFVRELKAEVAKLDRPVKISAAVFPSADEAKVLIGQDWPRWVKEGWIDMLCPMLYTNHSGFFEKYTRRAVEVGRGKSLVCPGIGIGTSHNQNTPQGMLDQMTLSRKLGGDGVIFFSSASLTADFLKKLKETRAPVPGVNK